MKLETEKPRVASETSAWPYFAPDEIEAVVRVLRSGKVNYWTGQEGKEFERELAAFAGCRHAVALANGTLALEVALRTMGVGAGDEVVTTPRSFIASASCAAMVGARPVFADVDGYSQNITAETIERVLTPKAIVAVHLAGWPCELDPILELAAGRGIHVIEDCAQAQGATYKGRPVGSMGEIGAFSFCQDKMMTTGGEGGAITLNSQDLYERAWAFKDNGKSYDAVYRRQHPDGSRWLHESFGTNGRLTEMQAAIGRIQLTKVPDWVRMRREHAARFDRVLAGVPGLRLTIPPAHVGHAYYRYTAFVEPAALRSAWTQDRIVAEINVRGGRCLLWGSSEMYLEKAFPPEWRPAESLPVTRELRETGLIFLVHPTLPGEEVERNAGIVRAVMGQAVR
jgi:dTDP-4-amino-4,6-dideoxygalactose transaminase